MTASTLPALALGLLACLSPVPGHTQAFLDDPVEAEVLPGWVQPDGSRVAALRLTLDPGWKTYWRSPGDTGIPPEFDWSHARNLAGVRITWPTPTVYVDSGVRSIGYTGQVVIPLHIAPERAGQPVRLRSTLSMGVCSDICMPYTLKIDETLDGTATKPTPAIVAALAAAPYPAADAGVRASTCRITPTSGGMRIEARVTLPHTGGTEHAVIEAGRRGIWVSEADTRRSGNTVIAVSDMVQPGGGPFSVDRSAVRITILGDRYAVDVKGCTAG